MTTPSRSAVFLTARLASSRLPRKMLADIEGHPALAYPLRRMKAATRPDLFVLCTTTRAEDEAIAALGASMGWEVFRGDEEDVLARYLAAADRYDVDFMVNVDGDDLFCSVACVDALIAAHRQEGAHFYRCANFPLGGTPIGVDISALRDVCSWKVESDTQGWGKYFVESDRYRVYTLQADERLDRPSYRMTLDYPEDLEFFRRVAREMGAERVMTSDLEEITRFLDAHPEVVEISRQVDAQYWERFKREHGRFQHVERDPGDDFS